MKRIFASIIISLSCLCNGTAQEGKKIVDIVNEIKAEQGIKQSTKKTSTAHSSNEVIVEKSATQEKKESSHSVTPKSKKEVRFADSYELIIRLLEGNARFISGHTMVKDFVQQRAELTKSQHPFAVVLCCTDSHVPPELLFDESLGQLFIVRVAGNVVDSVALGSIEYAAEHLHTSLMIVLGHEGCGAVAATIQGGEVPPNIASLVRRIKPSVSKVKSLEASSLKDSRLVNACVEENVREQMKQSLLQSDVLEEMSENGELAIVGAIYSLESGTVRFLSAKSSGTSSVEHRNNSEDKGH
jgi:carbonic anhydrase